MNGNIKKADAAKAKADSLLKAGDALADTLPAESRRLLRLCRVWRAKQRRYEAEASR